MLFRTEAIDHLLRDSSQGRILLRSPAILWGCSISAFLLSIAIVILLFQAEHTQKIKVQGQVVAATSGALLIQILIPRDALPALHFEQRLPVHYLAFTEKEQDKYFASIKNLSRVPVKNDHDDVYFRVLMQPGQTVIHADGLAYPLTEGMEVETEIMLGKTHLLDWIFKPMLATEKRG